MTLGQIDMVEIPQNFPLWAQIAVALITLIAPTIIALIALWRSWADGKWKVKALENETRLKTIEAERDRDLSQTEMTRDILAVHREELNKIGDAIRESATIRREDESVNRQILEHNTKAMTDISEVVKGMVVQFKNVDIGLSRVDESNQLNIAKTEALTDASNSLHNDIRKQLARFDSVRDSIEEIRTSIKATAKQDKLDEMRQNFLEIFDSLEEGMQGLSETLQRSSGTQPINVVLDKNGNPLTPTTANTDVNMPSDSTKQETDDSKEGKIA